VCWSEFIIDIILLTCGQRIWTFPFACGPDLTTNTSRGWEWFFSVFLFVLRWKRDDVIQKRFASRTSLTNTIVCLRTRCEASRLSLDVVKITVAGFKPIETISDHTSRGRTDQRSVSGFLQESADNVVYVVHRRIERLQCFNVLRRDEIVRTNEREYMIGSKAFRRSTQ